MSRKAIALVLLFAAAGCTKQGDISTPQGVLKEYVSRTFGMTKVDDVKGLLDLTTGTAHDEIEKLSKDPEIFNKTFVEEKNTFDSSIKIRDERKVGDDRYSITYELTYKDQSPLTQDKVTTKKNVILVKKDDKWLISEVQTIKTFVEHTTEEKISAGPSAKE